MGYLIYSWGYGSVGRDVFQTWYIGLHMIWVVIVREEQIIVLKAL